MPSTGLRRDEGEQAETAPRAAFQQPSPHSLELLQTQTVKLTAETSKPTSHGNTGKSPAGALSFRANETFLCILSSFPPWQVEFTYLYIHMCTQSSA